MSAIPLAARLAFDNANQARHITPTVRTPAARAMPYIKTEEHNRADVIGDIQKKLDEKANAKLQESSAGREFAAMSPADQAYEIRRISGLNKLFGGRSVATVLDDLASRTGANRRHPRPVEISNAR